MNENSNSIKLLLLFFSTNFLTKINSIPENHFVFKVTEINIQYFINRFRRSMHLMHQQLYHSFFST